MFRFGKRSKSSSTKLSREITRDQRMLTEEILRKLARLNSLRKQF